MKTLITITLFLIQFFAFGLTEQKNYYDNGKLREVGFYDINNLRTGEWKWYHENGKLATIENYNNDKKVGEWKEYSANGQLLEIGSYEDGKEIGEWRKYHENGQLLSTGKYENYDKTGEWKWYHESGQLKVERKPANGKLNKFGLNTSEIERLKTFQSRDGFVILDETEFDEMENYFSQFPIYKNLVALLTDENSNYWCLNINGPMKGMICYLSHDEPNLEPKFKDISSFLKVIEENPEAYDFDDLDKTSFDFPNAKNPTEFNGRKEIVAHLKSDFQSENDEDVRTQIAYSIIALTSAGEIEDNIFPLLDDEDMYVQERAIQILGFHKYKPAKEKLIELKKTAMPNGQTAIGSALRKLNEN